MRERFVVRWASAALIAVCLVACTTSQPSSEDPTASPQAAGARELTPWETALSDIAPDGHRSLDAARRLFAMAFGPLPGVTVPSDPGPILSGSPAIRAITAHVAELTDEQRAAVETHLQVPTAAVRVEVPEAGGSADGAPAFASLTGAVGRGVRAVSASDGRRLASVDQAFVDQVAGIVAEGRAALARKWTDFPGGLPIFIGEASASALSWYEATGGSAGFQCRIVISETGAASPLETLRFSLYHELFHCAQAWRANLDVGDIPAWVWEGGARYFAADTVGFDGDPAWIDYMTKPDTSLFLRAYDAIGFWGHLRYARGADVYLSLEAALAPGSSEQRFAVVGADDAAFLDTWASGLASQIAPYGRAWTTDGPGFTPALSAPRDVLNVGPETQLLIDQDAYTNHLYALDGATDVIRIEIAGHGRLGDGAIDTTELSSAVFCLTDRGCQPCPDDLPLPRLADVSLLAISGGTSGTTGTVSGVAVDKPCPTPSPSTSVPPTPPDDGDDEAFCRRYRALVAWTERNEGIEFTQPWAAEIARQSRGLRPYAPYELLDEVDTFIRIYEAFAAVPEPANVPFVGPDAASLGQAVIATHQYCEIPLR